MKLKDGRISFYIGKDNDTTIELIDNSANTTFCKITLTNNELAAILSRMGYVNCKIELSGLDIIGKTHENKTFKFEITDKLKSSAKVKELNEICLRVLKESNMEEWIPDNYYGSQTSFSIINNKHFANVTIRRYI